MQNPSSPNCNLNEIKEQVKKVIAHSQGLNIDLLNIDNLMKDWEENKCRFYSRLPGNKLIYQTPNIITMPISNEDKEAALDNFIDDIRWHYSLELVELREFIEYNRNDFYNNSLSKDYPVKDGVVIPKGMKIIKAFKYFVKDKNTLTELQDKASMLIQNTKISGYFCISVHPLDYLSLSENTHNWRSCHALDGEYRAGNLSYMADNCTIVCYIKSEHNAVLPRFPDDVPWTDKKWRMLLHVSHDDTLLISGRHYPYESKGLQDFALELYETFFSQGYSFTKWCHEKYDRYELNGKCLFTETRMLPTGYVMTPDIKVIVDPKHPLHYNDPLHSTVYDYWFSIAYGKPYWYDDKGVPRENVITPRTGLNTKVNIGHDVKCCVCGKNDCVLTDTMLCIDCELKYGTEETEDFTFCKDCGRRIYIPEAISLDDDDGYVCHDCGDDYQICDNCNTYYNKKYLIYDEVNNAYYCEACYDEILFDRENE